MLIFDSRYRAPVKKCLPKGLIGLRMIVRGGVWKIEIGFIPINIRR